MARQPIGRQDNSSTETCGYVTFLLSHVFIVVYFLWALAPDRIARHIDEHYAVYYPPRELAVHVPAYLSLLFVLAPVLYMGLNMLSCRGADGIDGMWDTRSGDDDDGGDGDDGGDADRYLSSDSLPAIRDEDVGSVNSRVSRRLLAGSARDR